MTEFKFKVNQHVQIHAGHYFGHNGKIVERLSASGDPVYAVKILTGPYRNVPGSTVIREEHLRAE